MILHDNKQTTLKKTLRRAAFTLMEILVVVAIIVALAGVGGFFLIGQLNQSKGDVAKLQCKELAKACETFYVRYGQMPSGLGDLTAAPNGMTPILKDQKAIIDPWNNPYQMQMGPTGPIVFTTEPGTGRTFSSAD